MLNFNKNSSIGIGVEIEVQLIDPSSQNLIPLGAQILKQIGENENTARIKPEIFQSMLEIDTPICSNAIEVGKSLRESLDILRTHSNHLGCNIIMSGTHPFAHYTERLLTPEGRYYKLVDRNQWITRRLQIFGLHVHLGMRDGDHAIAMNNALCHYLPMILALSASSPYWQGQDTGLASSRITFFEAIPTGGHPYLLNSWSEFESLINKLIFSKSITSLKDLWWDIRPNTEYGTIEIRIADCPPTIKEVEALVALIHALTLFIDDELQKGKRFAPPPEWILRENKWRASRHGVDCDLIMDFEGASENFNRVWARTKEIIHPLCEKLKYIELISFLDKIIEKGPSYRRQRENADESLCNIVKHLERECLNDHPEWDTNCTI